MHISGALFPEDLGATVGFLWFLGHFAAGHRKTIQFATVDKNCRWRIGLPHRGQIHSPFPALIHRSLHMWLKSAFLNNLPELCQCRIQIDCTPYGHDCNVILLAKPGGCFRDGPGRMAADGLSPLKAVELSLRVGRFNDASGDKCEPVAGSDLIACLHVVNSAITPSGKPGSTVISSPLRYGAGLPALARCIVPSDAMSVAEQVTKPLTRPWSTRLRCVRTSAGLLEE